MYSTLFFKRIKATIFLVFLLVLFPGLYCYSQIQSANSQSKFLIKKISLKGLPDDSYFSSVQQDDDGFLWIGTLSGLFRYDGTRVVRFLYDPADSNSLGNNYASTLSKDREGNIWIGTFGSGFINIYEREPGKLKRIEPGINNELRKTIRKLKPSLDNKKMIAATTRCIYQISHNGNTLDSILFPQPLSPISDFIEYENNKFVVAATSAVFILDWKARRLTDLTFPSKSGENFQSIERDSMGNLWIGSRNGLLSVDLKNFTTFYSNKYSGSILSNIEINIIKKDTRGRMWIGTSDGLFIIDNNEIQKLNDAQNITDMFFDAKGTGWITTEDNGLYQVSESPIFFNTISGMEKYSKKNKIQSITEESPGVWLIGTMFGLYRYYLASQKFEKIKLAGAVGDKISGLFIDKKKGLWVGTADQGAFYKPAGQMEFINLKYQEENKNSIPCDFVVSFAEDEFNNIWIGTFSGGRDVKGLCFYDPIKKEITRIEGKPGDPRTFNARAISQIQIDNNHQLWIGTWDMGLFRYRLTGVHPEQNTFTQYADSSSGSHKISHNVVTCIEAGRNGITWFGTLSGGLNVLNNKKDSVYWFTMKDGMPSNLIYRIEEDDQGIIWMSTDHGIARFDPSTRSFVNYNTTSGLPANNFAYLTSMKSSDGTIVFGTNDGQVVYFNPNTYKNSVNTQPAVIIDIRLFNKSLEPGPSSILTKAAYLTDTLRLSYDQSVISFELSDMDFINPEIFTYAYKLTGFDKDWTYITDRNSITYTNLDPGTYTLLIKQSNHLGVWNEKPTKLTVIITPPFWKTWWFYFLIIIVTLFLAFLLTQNYVKGKLKKQRAILEKQRAVELERMRISSELHDDMGGELSAIRLLSEMDIPTINPRQQLSKISNSSAILIQKMNEIVWSLNVNNDSLQSLIAYIQNYASKYLDTMDIDCAFSQPDKIPDIELSGNTRRNIFLIVKESLNNVSKHSEAKKVEIKILAEESLFIYINDNGKGITPLGSNIITGNGFKNMQSRVKEMNGSMEVTNNNGTSLSFILPVLSTTTKG